MRSPCRQMGNKRNKQRVDASPQPEEYESVCSIPYRSALRTTKGNATQPASAAASSGQALLASYGGEILSNTNISKLNLIVNLLSSILKSLKGDRRLVLLL